MKQKVRSKWRPWAAVQRSKQEARYPYDWKCNGLVSATWVQADLARRGQFFLSCLFGLRQALGMVQSLLMAHLDWRLTAAPPAVARNPCRCKSAIAPARRTGICWWTARALNSRAKASGSVKNTGLYTGACGQAHALTLEIWTIEVTCNLVTPKRSGVCKRLGERATAQTLERQVVELRAALRNRFSPLGRPQAVVLAAVASMWSLRVEFDVCNKAVAYETT